MADINIGYEEIVNTQVDMSNVSYFCFPCWTLITLIYFIIHCLLLSVFLKVVGFNGKPVKNLKSLAAMVESCDDEYLKFDLDYEQVRLYFSICLACLKKWL